MTARASRSASTPEPMGLLRGWALFVREAITNPRDVGAVVPSSPTLARRMARLVDPAQDGLVIELGAGTGVVTEALLKRGVPPHRLVAIERSTALAEHLRVRFPGLRVICGDAADLRQLLRRYGSKIAAGRNQIVSSLPLRSIPAPKVLEILGEIGALLRGGGHWVQYTYALSNRQAPEGFVRRNSILVWKNVPPARVDVFQGAPSGPG